MCKVTDCVTGETYVRGAAGRMATEIEGLKGRVAELERENEELQRNASSMWDLEHTSPLTAPGVSSTTILHRQHRQSIAREQQMVTLQIEIAQLRQQNATLRESNQALRKQLENQEEMLHLRDVSSITPQYDIEESSDWTVKDVPLYNARFNWSL